MRTTTIPPLLLVTFAALVACSAGKDSDPATSIEGASEVDPGSADDDPAARSGQTDSERAAAGASLEVSRTREGNGGIIAVAGELTMEFDYSRPQGNCRTSNGTFVARGIGIDDEAAVSIDYATIVAPDTGKVVGQVLNLEISKDGYVPWAVNSARAGSVQEASLDTSPGGGVTLTVTGVASGFRKNRATTGIRKPFRLEATCDP